MKIAAPLPIHSEAIRPEWIDYNGHMNVAYYMLVFDHTVDSFMEVIGIGRDYIERSENSIFALDTRIAYMREVLEGQIVRCTVQLLDFDHKRLHYCFEMQHRDEGWTSAYYEAVSIHVNLNQRRSVPMPDPALERLTQMKAAHADLAKPASFQRSLGLDKVPVG